MSYRSELVQVAAVAVAMIEDLKQGQAKHSGVGGLTDDILVDVLNHLAFVTEVSAW